MGAWLIEMATQMNFDVIIIGAGPAGIFAAIELTGGANHPSVLLLEKGRDLHNRVERDPSSILCGWGGAGAYSDGKLNLSPHVGGQLEKYMPMPALEELIEYVDAIYVKFGASTTMYGEDMDAISRFSRSASLAGLKLVVSRIRHIGTEKCFDVLAGIREFLDDKITFIPDTPVESIIVKNGRVAGVSAADGREFRAECIIVAPGREGAEWLTRQADAIGLPREHNPVDIGVRVEVPAAVMQPLAESLYESKFLFASRSFDDPVRTFCMCPRGEVVIEKNNGVTTVNGHSYSKRFTENTNFAVLVSTSFTKPFNDPISYGKYVASLANLLGGGVIVQRLGDLHNGRRSTERRIEKGSLIPTLKQATPGDLSFVLPYRYLTDIQEMLEALDRVAPGVNERHTLLYGVEVKFYSSRLKMDENLETQVQGLFAVGDGAGITRGLLQASVSGIVAARGALKKMESNN